MPSNVALVNSQLRAHNTNDSIGSRVQLYNSAKWPFGGNESILLQEYDTPNLDGA